MIISNLTQRWTGTASGVSQSYAVPAPAMRSRRVDRADSISIEICEFGN